MVMHSNFGLTNKGLIKFQRLQTYPANTILGKNRYESLALARYQLHWLPVEERITFKVLTLVYKCLNNQGTLYLQQLVENQESQRATRSNGKRLLKNSPPKKILDRSFTISGPRLWNKLPNAMRNAMMLKGFKCIFKTLLFRQAYDI